MSQWIRADTQFKGYSAKYKSYINLRNCHNKLLKKIKGPSQAQCNELANILNQIYFTLSQENFANLFSEQITNFVKQQLGEKLETEISKNINIYTNLGSEVFINPKLNATSNQLNELKNELKKTTDSQRSSDLKLVIQSLQGQASRYSGLALEAFLDTIGKILEKEAINSKIDLTEKTIKSLANSIVNYDKGFSGGVGDQLTDDIELNINLGEDKIPISIVGKRKQKIDVEMKAPYIGYKDLLKISAKNYARLSDVPLLTDGSFFRLLVDGFNRSPIAVKFFLNALSIKNPNWLNKNSNRLYLRKILLIEALAGSTENKANILVYLNRNSKKNPFRVLSIYDLFNKKDDSIIDQSVIITTGDPGAPGDPNPALPSTPIKGNNQSRVLEDLEAIRNWKIAIKLSRKILYIKSLENIL